MRKNSEWLTMWGRRGAGFIARHFFAEKSKKNDKKVLRIKINVIFALLKQKQNVKN